MNNLFSILSYKQLVCNILKITVLLKTDYKMKILQKILFKKSLVDFSLWNWGIEGAQKRSASM